VLEHFRSQAAELFKIAALASASGAGIPEEDMFRQKIEGLGTGPFTLHLARRFTDTRRADGAVLIERFPIGAPMPKEIITVCTSALTAWLHIHGYLDCESLVTPAEGQRGACFRFIGENEVAFDSATIAPAVVQ
jgi:hypothetical protein